MMKQCILCLTFLLFVFHAIAQSNCIVREIYSESRYSFRHQPFTSWEKNETKLLEDTVTTWHYLITNGNQETAMKFKIISVETKMYGEVPVFELQCLNPHGEPFVLVRSTNQDDKTLVYINEAYQLIHQVR